MSGLVLEGAGPARARLGGRELVLFGGCDYLGLSGHPRVLDALRAGLERFGVSSGASRATSGTADAHEALETELARFLGVERARLLPDGWLANVALCEALRGVRDLALIDARAHPSLPGAARAAGMDSVDFGHADAVALVRRLDERRPARPLAMTDGVFPALGACAPVAALLRALPAEGLLLVDDCHGLGVLGARGRGTLEHLDVDDQRVVLSGTLSKALGCQGGFVAGPAQHVDAVTSAPAYVGTTPIAPALAAAARAALAVLGEGEALARLRSNVARLRATAAALGLRPPALEVPVLPLAPGGEEAARRLHEALLDDGLLVPLVRYPGGPEGAWLRLVVSAAHRTEDLERLHAALGRHLPAAQRA